jgi:daunorubicin resistance ABC transporter ATP-binding subunit
MIEVTGISKAFGSTKALDNVDLAVQRGTVLGLLGPNGAGKTTLVRVLATLLLPDSGSARINGVDVLTQPQQARELIGLAGQYAAVDELLTGRENLVMVGRLYGLSKAEAVSRAAETLQRLSLTDAADRPVRTYSGGMRRRLDLGASLVGRPIVLILDEPTTGLDPRTRSELWEFIKDLVAAGTTVLLTTQYLEEADALADRIVVLDRGAIIAEGTADELKARQGGDVVDVKPVDPTHIPELETLLAGIAGQPQVDRRAGRVLVPVGDRRGVDVLTAVARTISDRQIELDDLAIHRPSLDDVFLALTGHAAEPADDSDTTTDTATSVGAPRGGRAARGRKAS